MCHMADYVNKAVAAGNTNGRTVVGSGGPGLGGAGGYVKGDSTLNLQPKKGEAKADTFIGAGTAAHRTQREGYGAAYKIKQTFPAQTPQAQETQANGRIIPASHSRDKGFYSQAAGL